MKDSIFVLPSGETNPNLIGYGPLLDGGACTIQNVINGVYELGLSYSFGGVHYSHLSKGNLISSKVSPDQGQQLFRIYSVKKDINANLSIAARHISYDLSGVLLSAFDLEEVTVSDAVSNISEHLLPISNNGDEEQDLLFTFTVDYDSGKKRSFEVKQGTSIREYIGMLLEGYGDHEIFFDNYRVVFKDRIGSNTNCFVSYGINLISCDVTEDLSDSGSDIYPYKKEGDAVTDIQEGSKLVKTGVNLGYRKILSIDFSNETWSDPEYEGKSTDEQLRAAANKYIMENRLNAPASTITAKIVSVDATQIQKQIGAYIHLGDTLHFLHERLGISMNIRCVSYKYDATNDRYSDIVLGELSPTLEDNFVPIAKQSNFE